MSTGRIGDRAGRKAAMVLSFTLMGIGIVGLALTPSYATIGLAAPVLLLVFRLLQGFALGGQVGPARAWLSAAALDRWGWRMATIINGVGNLTGDVLSRLCSDRIGRKPVMLFSILLLLLLVLPAYLAMTHFPGALTVYLATSVLCVLQQMFGNAALVTIAESLPTGR